MEQIDNLLASTYKVKRFILNRDFCLSVVVAVVVIAFGVFLGYYNNKVVITNPAAIAHYTQEPSNPLSFMSNWDGPDYLAIEKAGYSNVAQTNFFPLYPLITRLVNVIISSPLDSALAVAWLSFVGAIYFYLKIIKLLFHVTDNVEAFRGLLLFVFFPTAIFFLASYTESLFAFLALGSIYNALRKKYWASALFLLFAMATHVTGLFVLVLILMILLEQKAKIITVLRTAVIGCLGLLAYAYFLQVKFHKPLAFITSQESHGWLDHGFANLLVTVDIFNVIFIILLLISAVYWWKRKKSFSIYSLMFLLIPLVGRQFGGFNRYVLMAFPVELMFYAYLRNKKLGYSLAMVVLGVTWTYFLFQYAGGYIGG